MTHEARKTDVLRAVDERPFDLPEGLRAGVSALFAPMDRSIASSIVSAVVARSTRRRSLQAFWLGLSPAVVLAFVAVLYVGGMGLLPASRQVASQGMVAASNPDVRASDFAAKGLTAPENPATLAARSPQPSLKVDLQGDPVRRGILVSWLRAGHPDVAVQLETGESGATVSLALEAGEASRFVSVMVLHGFVGQEPSGLALSVQSPSEAWMWALRAASYAVCLAL
jgi:hypothetical protein